MSDETIAKRAIGVFIIVVAWESCRRKKWEYKSFAERGGFEPPIPFRGIHAFQACLFNHSSTSPCSGRKSKGSFWNYQMFGQIILKVRSSNQCRNGLSTLNKTYLSLP